MGRLCAGLVSGVWVLLLVVTVFSVVLNVPLASGSGTIYIRADGSIDPPTAPITTVDRVTYTLTGNISSDADGIVVEKDNIVVDGAGYTLQGSGVYYYEYKGISLLERSNVTIENLRITMFEIGIRLTSCSNITISGNNMTNNEYDAIILSGSSNSTIAGNHLIDSYRGITLYSSSNNTISENNIIQYRIWWGMMCGISLYGSSANSISRNNIANHCEDGIRLSGSSRNSITANNITSNGWGIWLENSIDNMLRSNSMTHNGRNFFLFGSWSDAFVNDVDTSNTVDGKPVYYWINRQDMAVPLDAGYVALVNCANITAKDLNLTNNGQGLLLVDTTNSTITKNNMMNNWYGIDLFWSDYNYVVENNLTDSGYGIFLHDSSRNSISRNNIANNTDYGILLDYSSNNRFYHNNLIDNIRQVYIYQTGHANTWDDGYPSGGNYWSNYTGEDANGDGIGDTPYVINENNTDRYPLMNPWAPPEHELATSISAPLSLRLGTSSSLNAIVTNDGLNDEGNVELWLLINGSIANLTIVPILQAGDSYVLNYLWTPTVEGIYNVTAYAPPVHGEALTENNQQTAFVNVSAPEIVVSIMAPASLRVGTSSSLKAIVSNQGLSNETNVELRLLINGSIMNSKTISFLRAGDSYTLSYLWTPTVEGTYNVTAYARPLSGEASVENNQMTKFVTVTVSAPPGVQVGVKAGDWIKYDYTVTGWPAGTPYPKWLKVEFLGVEGTNATIRVTMHMSDGTEQNATVPVDVVAGGQAFGLSGFVVSANLTTGDVIFMSGYGNVTIAGETTRAYAGASRTVVYASFSQYGTQLTYYWDKRTGVMVEASVTSGTMTGTGKATETNMWQAVPGFPIDPIMLSVLIAIVVVIVIAVFLVRRKKKPTEAQKPETQP